MWPESFVVSFRPVLDFRISDSNLPDSHTLDFKDVMKVLLALDRGPTVIFGHMQEVISMYTYPKENALTVDVLHGLPFSAITVGA